MDQKLWPKASQHSTVHLISLESSLILSLAFERFLITSWPHMNNLLEIVPYSRPFRQSVRLIDRREISEYFQEMNVVLFEPAETWYWKTSYHFHSLWPFCVSSLLACWSKRFETTNRSIGQVSEQRAEPRREEKVKEPRYTYLHDLLLTVIIWTN